MPRNWHYDAKLMACVGRKGRGKSTLHRQLIREFPARNHIIFDHKGEFYRELPAPRCTTYEHCKAALIQTQSCVFDPRPMFGSDHEKAFEDFCRRMLPVMQVLKGPHLFSFDEAGLLLPDNWKLFKSHPFHEIADDGRTWEIDVCLGAQAPTDMTLKFRNQVTHWFVFSLGCQEAADSLRQYGYEWESIKALEKGEYIAYNHNTGELFPKQRTIPDKKR